MRLTILGNSAGGPFQGRNFTAQVLQVGSQVFIVDCGEGTQQQLYRYKVKVEKVAQIFISHLHGDHVFGLIGLLTGFVLKKRTEKLQIFSPPGLRELIEVQVRVCGVHLSYPIECHEVDASVAAVVFENKTLEVISIPLRHRMPTCGWLFREKTKDRHILPEKIEEYKIPFSLIPAIKRGEDLVLPDGAVVPNDLLTTPPTPSRAYAFCSDTAFHPPIADLIKGVDVLYHEATFVNDHAAQAELSFHSTAGQAAEIARMAGAGCLIIGHISARYADWEQHLQDARAVFPNTVAAEEGRAYMISNDE